MFWPYRYRSFFFYFKQEISKSLNYHHTYLLYGKFNRSACISSLTESLTLFLHLSVFLFYLIFSSICTQHPFLCQVNIQHLTCDTGNLASNASLYSLCFVFVSTMFKASLWSNGWTSWLLSFAPNRSCFNLCFKCYWRDPSFWALWMEVKNMQPNIPNGIILWPYSLFFSVLDCSWWWPGSQVVGCLKYTNWTKKLNWSGLKQKKKAKTALPRCDMLILTLGFHSSSVFQTPLGLITNTQSEHSIDLCWSWTKQKKKKKERGKKGGNRMEHGSSFF